MPPAGLKMRTLLVLCVVFSLVIACAPSKQDLSRESVRDGVAQSAAPELPRAFDAALSDTELKSRFKITEIFAVSHPEYSLPLKILVQESTGELGELELAFYELRDGLYRIVDTSQ